MFPLMVIQSEDTPTMQSDQTLSKNLIPWWDLSLRAVRFLRRLSDYFILSPLCWDIHRKPGGDIGCCHTLLPVWTCPRSDRFLTSYQCLRQKIHIPPPVHAFIQPHSDKRPHSLRASAFSPTVSLFVFKFFEVRMYEVVTYYRHCSGRVCLRSC